MQRRMIGVVASLLILAVLIPIVVPAHAQPAETGWRGEYFANETLAGNPEFVRQDPSINFNWGAGSPGEDIPADSFSVRWTNNVYFDQGRYRFTTETDDGVRLYIDGNLLLNKWQRQSRTRYAVDVNLSAGRHSIRVEYFEGGGGALARVWWQRLDQPGTPTGIWRGEYFNNRTLTGDPAMVRQDQSINFNWGAGSPAGPIQADNFSVRWSQNVFFDAGRYRFTTQTDDGVRLYVDGNLVIDDWFTTTPNVNTADVELATGTHSIRMEYFEAGGGALARLSWQRLDEPGVPANNWRGEYFDNANLSGSPEIVRNDDSIDFEWGAGSPDPEIAADTFSVRWTRSIDFAPGRYRFTTETDDGVRLYIDDRLIIDEWHPMADDINREIDLSGSVHTIRMEYFERTGAATAKLSWDGPLVETDVGNIITCVPPQPENYAWIKVYRLQPDGDWKDMNPHGYGSINDTGWLKIEGLPVNVARYGDAGHPYRVEQYINGELTRAVGNKQGSFRVRAGDGVRTPWQCAPPQS